MKKISYVLLIILCLSLMGCTNDGTQNNNGDITDDNNDTNNNNDNNGINDNNDTTNGTDNNGVTDDTNGVTYKDGSYNGKGDPWEYGSEDATVVVKDGKMDSITLRRFDNDNNEVDYDMWTGEEVDGKTYPNLKQARIDLAKEMIAKQTYNVDAIAGSTVSSENWKLSVQRALDEAK